MQAYVYSCQGKDGLLSPGDSGSFPAPSTAGVVSKIWGHCHPLDCFWRIQVGAKDHHYMSLMAMKLENRHESALAMFRNCNPGLRWKKIPVQKWNCIWDLKRAKWFCMFYSIPGEYILLTADHFPKHTVHFRFPTFQTATGFSSCQHSLKMALPTPALEK